MAHGEIVLRRPSKIVAPRIDICHGNGLPETGKKVPQGAGDNFMKAAVFLCAGAVRRTPGDSERKFTEDGILGTWDGGGDRKEKSGLAFVYCGGGGSAMRHAAGYC